MDAIKRRNTIKDTNFKTRVSEYFYKKANEILLAGTPDPENTESQNNFIFAQALFAGQVKEEDMTRLVAYNATIGASIDAGTEIQEDHIEYAVLTESRYTTLANIYKSAGLI